MGEEQATESVGRNGVGSLGVAAELAGEAALARIQKPEPVEGRGPVVRQRDDGKHVPGEPGVWIFILGDMSIFAVLFGVYIVGRGDAPALFESQQQLLNQNFGALNTILLLVSSLLVYSGVNAIRKQDLRAPLLFIAAIVCGLGFVVVKYFEYSQKIDHGLTPALNDFWMYYFVLTGLHLFHLLLGLGVLTLITLNARRAKPGSTRFALIEGGACFWHMVDFLWIILFPLLYLVGE